MPEKKCMRCATLIPAEAKICPYCKDKLGSTTIICWAILVFLVVVAWIASLSTTTKPLFRTTQADEIWHKKYVLVKAMDEGTSKRDAFDKIEIGTPDRVEVTLDMKNAIAYRAALDLMPRFKEVGFRVLRLKSEGSDRCEDHKIE